MRPASDRINEYPLAFKILLALLKEQAFISLFLIEVGTPIFNDRRVACTSIFFTTDTGVIFFCFSLGVTIIINIFENSLLIVLINQAFGCAA